MGARFDDGDDAIVAHLFAQPGQGGSDRRRVVREVVVHPEVRRFGDQFHASLDALKSA